MVMLIADKVDFRILNITDIEEYLKMIKESIHHD